MLLQKMRCVYVVSSIVDFRKAHTGLLGECYRLGLKPYSGDVVVFIGKCRSKLKLLHADENGLWVSYKKFDEDTIKTKFRFLREPECEVISRAELAMLLEGNAYTLDRQPKKQLQ